MEERRPYTITVAVIVTILITVGLTFTILSMIFLHHSMLLFMIGFTSLSLGFVVSLLFLCLVTPRQFLLYEEEV